MPELCTMTNTGGKLIFDVSGTSPQCTGFANRGIGGMRSGRLNDFSHPTAQMTRTERPRFFHRQFYCPGCGLMWANEMARPGDPILRDFEHDPHWLARL